MEAYISQIMMLGTDWAPKDWANCDGAVLPVQSNQALAALLGRTYGGDGHSSFGLPDLRGRVPMQYGDYPLGGAGGEETHTLTLNELPAHTHTMEVSSTDAQESSPADHVYAKTASASIYGAGPMDTTLNAQTLGQAGGSQAHTNMQPSLALNFVICVSGNWPPRD